MAKKRSIIKRNRFLAVLILLFLLYIGSTLVRQELRMYELKAEEKEAEGQLASLNGEIAVLKEDLEASKTLEFAEKVAREKLKMVKPDEIVYVLKDSGTQAPENGQ